MKITVSGTVRHDDKWDAEHEVEVEEILEPNGAMYAMRQNGKEIVLDEYGLKELEYALECIMRR